MGEQIVGLWQVMGEKFHESLLIFNMRAHINIARIPHYVSNVASTQVVVIFKKYFAIRAHLCTHSAFPWALCHCLKTPVSEMH